LELAEYAQLGPGEDAFVYLGLQADAFHLPSNVFFRLSKKGGVDGEP